jgi:hypothetical protein
MASAPTHRASAGPDPHPSHSPSPQGGPAGSPELDWIARLPEEESPSGAADVPVLFLRIVDAALHPAAGLRVELRGAGRYRATTDHDGVLWLDCCEPGPYELRADARTATVPALYLSDLAHDKRPYLVII